MSKFHALSLSPREPAAWSLPPESGQAAAQSHDRAVLRAELLGDMNHDLRTPLNGIIGLTLALGATDLSATQRELVDLIRVSGLSLERMIEQMLLEARDRVRAPLHDGPARILVVDDQVLNRAAVATMLEPLSAEIVEAEDGETAVSLYAERDFDLVIMDVEMPRLDGLSAVRAIRYLEREESRPRKPIFMLTAREGPEHERASLAAGADLHITKPVVARRLLAAAEGALTPVRSMGRQAG